MNNIIKELIEKGISVKGEFNLETETPEFVIDGFYKSGQVILFERDGKLIAKARYNEETEIEELRDIVNLNYKWWQRSKDRYEGWTNPSTAWIPLLVEFGFITKSEKTVVSYI